MLAKVEVYSEQSVDELLIGGDTPNTALIQLRDIDGLGPVKSNIVTAPRAVHRGESLTGNSIPKRNIVLTLGYNPDWEDNTILSLRHQLYTYFMTGAWVKLRFFSVTLPTTDIEGYVESFEPNIFSKDPEIQISVICPQPDFVDIESTVIEGFTNDTAEEIDYIGTVSTGFHLEIVKPPSSSEVTGPIEIINLDALEASEIFVVDWANDDELDLTVEFSSVQGQKFVRGTDALDEVFNLLKYKTETSKWPEFKFGTNTFSVETPIDFGSHAWTLTYYNRFGGL